MTKKINLSFSKFVNLLQKHRYILVTLYVDGDRVIFAECRTPRQQKTFIVYITERYFLQVSHDQQSYKRVDVTLSDEPPSSRRIQYIAEIKGPLLECDLVSISPENICTYSGGGKAECYSFLNGEENDESISEDEKDEDEIETIEKSVEKVMKSVDPDAQLPKTRRKKRKEKVVTPPPTPHESEDEEEEYIPDEEEIKKAEIEDIPEEGEPDLPDQPLKNDATESASEEEEVELVFENEEGEEVDEVKLLMDDETAMEEQLNEIRRKLKDEDEDIDVEEYDSRNNTIPDGMDESDLTLGIVYVLVPIRLFFKGISEYETKIIDCYEQLDDNEVDMRQSRLNKIKEMSSEFLIHAQKRLDKIHEEEESLKGQLLRLTVALSQVDALNEKIKSQPEKYDELPSEIERIYSHTRKAIHELNMELLNLRETADEVLTNYKLSFEDMMEL